MQTRLRAHSAVAAKQRMTKLRVQRFIVQRFILWYTTQHDADADFDVSTVGSCMKGSCAV
jgi:hypothetical protein